MKKIDFREVHLALARKSLWEYAKIRAPKFYRDDRPYLFELCRKIQHFIETDDDNVLVINAPPRHGKSRTAQLAVEWILGNDQTQKIMTGSYNETVATTFSKGVRNAIQEQKADQNVIVYSDIFPGVSIQEGDAAMNMWSLTHGHQNYLATSPKGTATGFGATFMIIDDLIKSAEEANNEMILDKQWDWFIKTMLSRLEEGGKILIIMTRWHSKDIAGRVMEELPKIGFSVDSCVFKALQDDGTMLCPSILSRERYEANKKAMGIEIAEANYQQTPIDIKGRLYTNLKTYSALPENIEVVKNYTDTADEGDDYLCSINYAVVNKEAYILNVLFTKDAMEKTEPETAKMLYDDKVNVADIESNNGGRGFARSVERHLTEDFHSNYCRIEPFHQTKNKNARILSNATWVMDHIYFPENWGDKWPEFYQSMKSYQREGKNKHDDAQDCITGIAERVGLGSRWGF